MNRYINFNKKSNESNGKDLIKKNKLNQVKIRDLIKSLIKNQKKKIKFWPLMYKHLNFTILLEYFFFSEEMGE